MTAIEAIEILRDTPIDIRSTREDDIHTLYATAQGMAINALEKQIPKKPLDKQTPVITWAICPVCKGERNMRGGKANRIFKSNEYCPDCGQRLDWSDTDG